MEGEPLPGELFGEGPAASLKEALQIAEEMGFETANMENYCGYAQMGSGEETIGLCARLDVASAGEGWNAAPFTLVRQGEKGNIIIEKIGKPLFYPDDSALVQNLLKAYQEVTGDMEHKPEVFGGSTYAKSVPGIIAFGCEFPGDDNHIHDADESLLIRDYQTQVDIYAQAILNLLKG